MMNFKSKEEFLKNWKSYVSKLYNPNTDKGIIIKENKGKSGIYMFINIENNKCYVGQSKDLGNAKGGRLIRYLQKSYLADQKRGASLIVKALIKYGYNNFLLAVLEYCPIEQLDEREQYWIDLLQPDYNILKIAKSSSGYKHTQESLEKMRGKRPHFTPSAEHRTKIGISAKTRVYDNTFKDNISERNGFTVYVYDTNGNLIGTYSSINRLKEAYNIKLHHNTLIKYIAKGKLFDGYRFSFTPLSKDDFNIQALDSFPKIKNKAKKIKLTNLNDSNLSISLDSLSSAAAYIKKIDGASDRVTMRNYLNTNKKYRKSWIITEIDS